MKENKRNLRLLSHVPEDKTKQNSNACCHDKPDTVIFRVSPIRLLLFPKTSIALSKKRLGVFGWEVKILRAWCWSTKLFDKFLIPPEILSIKKLVTKILKILRHMQKNKPQQNYVFFLRFTDKEQSWQKFQQNPHSVEPQLKEQ